MEMGGFFCIKKTRGGPPTISCGRVGLKSIGISVLGMRCGMVAVTVKWIFKFIQSVLAVI